MVARFNDAHLWGVVLALIARFVLIDSCQHILTSRYQRWGLRFASRVHLNLELEAILQRLYKLFKRDQAAFVLVDNAHEFLDVFVDLALFYRPRLGEDGLQHVRDLVRVDLAATVLVCEPEGLFHLHKDGRLVRLRVQEGVAEEHLQRLEGIGHCSLELACCKLPLCVCALAVDGGDSSCKTVRMSILLS
ncbi:hypothetical protein GQ600_8157 [Phytophthora cactorum]|nr:hypothetical protein GQ600_8157 [Phytophthora cactorum]